MRSPRRSIEHGSRDAAAADVYRHRARLRGLLWLVSAWPSSGPFDCWCSTCVYYIVTAFVYIVRRHREIRVYFSDFLVIFVVEVPTASAVVRTGRNFRKRLDLPSNTRCTHPPQTFSRISSRERFSSSLPSYSYFPIDMATTSSASWTTSSTSQSECYSYSYIFDAYQLLKRYIFCRFSVYTLYHIVGVVLNFYVDNIL